MKDLILFLSGFFLFSALLIALFRSKCPKCGKPLPIISIPKSLSDALLGRKTCRNCGIKINMRGKEIIEETKEIKSQSPKNSGILKFFAVLFFVLIIIAVFLAE